MKKAQWMGWDRMMVYILEDGKVKMAKDAPGVIEALIPEVAEVLPVAGTPYRLIRSKGKRNALASSLSRKKINGTVLIVKETENAYGERSWIGMSAEEAGRWVGKLIKAKKR